MLKVETLEELKAEYNEQCKKINYIRDQIFKCDALISYLHAIQNKYEDKFWANREEDDYEDGEFDQAFDDWYCDIGWKIDNLVLTKERLKWYLSDEEKVKREKMDAYIARLSNTNGRDEFLDFIGKDSFPKDRDDYMWVCYSGLIYDEVERDILSYGFSPLEEDKND